VTDLVNHPPHYTSHPSGVECIEVVEHMSFNVGNAVKYLWRAGEKGNQLQDLRKAAWYVNREISRLADGANDAPEQEPEEAGRCEMQTGPWRCVVFAGHEGPHRYPSEVREPE
jgi:hypothetical protein